jgi:predicted nucleic acid-binding protein
MSYLLDTNVISELRKKKNANAKVVAFTNKIPETEFYLSVLSIGEICQGIEKLPAGKKKVELSVWLYTQVPEYFRNRILNLDWETMLAWGRFTVETKRTLPLFDSLLAATALAYNMTLLTRNAADFASISGLSLINPWDF